MEHHWEPDSSKRVPRVRYGLYWGKDLDHSCKVRSLAIYQDQQFKCFSKYQHYWTSCLDTRRSVTRWTSAKSLVSEGASSPTSNPSMSKNQPKMENKINYTLESWIERLPSEWFSKSSTPKQNSLLIIVRYRLFHEKAKKSAAVEKFCAHGGRYIFWLPYRFEVSITIDF